MFGKFLLCSPEAYSETGQSSKLESFANIVYEFPRLTIFAKYSILDVWMGSEYVYVLWPWINRRCPVLSFPRVYPTTFANIQLW